MLSVCTGVGGCSCPIYSSVCLAGTALQKLMSRAPNSASVAEYTTVLIICEIMRIAPFLARFSVLSDMKKWRELAASMAGRTLSSRLFLPRHDIVSCFLEMI